MIPARHALIDAHASLAQQEIREMASKALDELAVRVGWMRRSTGQKRRWANSKKGVAQNAISEL